MANYSEVTVVIPTLNESHETLKTLSDSLTYAGFEVIVVDDGSQAPFPEAIKHGANFGYGSALMTGIKNATRNIVLTMDGDGQHTVTDAKNLCAAWALMKADMLIGTRRLKHEKALRFLGRKFLNSVASLIACHWFPDLNSGMRIFRRDVALGYFPILCKTFSFTTSITMSMFCDGYQVEWFPIQVRDRTEGKSRVKVFKHGWITLKYIIWIGLAIRTRGIRAWIRGLYSR